MPHFPLSTTLDFFSLVEKNKRGFRLGGDFAPSSQESRYYPSSIHFFIINNIRFSPSGKLEGKLGVLLIILNQIHFHIS